MKQMIKKPEILSPAGNLEKLIFAVNYGADAVYCALNRFGMRAAADNFTLTQLDEGIRYAHTHGAKVYLTMNTLPHESELPELKECLLSLSQTVIPDAFIVADIGVMELIRQYIPGAIIHLSTQASTVNSAACSFWYKYGVKRIVLARELNLTEITEIRKNIPADMELEAFVHGAMCVSYSGRCLLSNYYTSRNANDGRCAQPCRWRYHVCEEKRTGDILTAEQYDEGTYLFSSKDMCMIDHLDDICNTGINSLKIEGRMKSAYYTACVTNAYKMALDNLFTGKEFLKSYYDEVAGVSHREYCTGYYYTSPMETANIVFNNEYLCEKAFLATVSDFDTSTGLARCIQRNKMCKHTKAQLLTPGSVGKSIEIEELFDVNMNPIESTPHAKMEFFVKIDFASPGDIIRAF